ncbi:protein Shroom2 isoform X2 [Genypterus blacodes]|uniref:protein Shroom2 isoform X2 n=1 Tax=Genypterus blacodes TaxID=154954 RepID=UPI003F75BD5C
MDPGRCRNDPQYTEEVTVWHVMQKSADLDQRSRDADGWKLVNAYLSGGAPWGFTLKGGLEHREPLLITKVEEGSKAAAVSLQVGDELVNINEIPLSGYRQEAICLVKGSHKTLSVVVKRRNEPISRPHSWHATKFNENQSEPAKIQSPPTQVWHTRYDASSSSTDLSAGWEQTNLRRVSDQFSSLGSMDSLEQGSHPYPAGQLSPAKSNNSMEHLGGGKRDSAYSSFSTSSGTPDYTLSKSNAASTENMHYKVSQWDAGGKHSRNSQCLIEGAKQDERLGYFQMPGGSTGRDSPQTEDHAGSRQSTSSRTSYGPVWHVPEKKKTTSPSPPPPLPPARSDSFAAIKVHERGVIVGYPEGPDSRLPCKPSDKGIDRRVEVAENAKHVSESRHSHNLPPKHDDHFYSSPEKINPTQFSSNKQFSLSSTDVRLGQPPHGNLPYHQRHSSDKSTFYSQPWAAPAPKPQNMGDYYSNMQELPPNGSAKHFGETQGKTTSIPQAATAPDQNPDGSAPPRYYCVTTCQPTQPTPQAFAAKPEDRKSVTGLVDLVQTGNEPNSLSSQMVTKVKYHLPYQQQQQQQLSHSKDSNGLNKQDENTQLKQTITPMTALEASIPKLSCEDRGGNQRRPKTQPAEARYMNQPSSTQVPEQRRSLPLQQRESEIRHQSQVSTNIRPSETPMLHSLSITPIGQEDSSRATNPYGSQESLEAKQVRRADRFATTLRNEIQMRRAKLQKSKSATTLPNAEGETEEDQNIWSSTESSTPTSANGSFTDTYKDNLKEAQARVLKATSFRRKDLVLLEHPVAEALPSYPSSMQGRKDVTPLPTVSESAHGSGQVTRIGGRKRFSAEKKVRSFSEPDKIHEVGVEDDLPNNEIMSSSLDQQRLIKVTGKPAIPNPQPLQSYTENPTETKVRGLSSSSETEDTIKVLRSKAIPPTEYSEENQGGLYSADQRLGTFAEYEARWNDQKKPPETKASGKYRSAENILDPQTEERSKPVCYHERSRSSPSAEIFGQAIPGPGRKKEYYQTESKPAEQLNAATGFSDRGPAECKVREKPVELKHYSAPPPLPMTGTNPDCRHRAVNHRPASIPQSLTDSSLPHPEDRSHADLPSGPKRKPSTPEKPPLHKTHNSRRPEIPPPSLTDSQESFTSSQSEVFTHCSPYSDLNSTLVPTHSPQRESEQGRGLVDKGQGAVHQAPASNPPPASSPLASSGRPSLWAAMEGQRSPSPQFSPQRLSDKPPVCLQEEEANRTEEVIETQNHSVKKVPIRIVHSEGDFGEIHPFLQHSDAPPAETEGCAVPRLSSLGSAGPDSVFCAFTRGEKEPDYMQTAQTDPSPQRETDRTNSSSQQAPQADEPGSKEAVSSEGLSEEDQKREKLARDIMGKDKSLADILDQSKMKTTMDLMEGIFPQGEQVLEGAHQRKKVPTKQNVSRSTEEREKADSVAAAVTMVTSSAYYSTSAPKAELLIKMKDMQEQQEQQEEDSEEELDHELADKKELIDSLSRKLQVLRDARESLQEDILDNNALGDEVEVRVQQVCKPNELDKFRMFVGDLDKVVSLLLSLSGRLARVENALNSLEEEATPEERRTLIEKRKTLIRQHEDAKELKENLDRRERVVYDILASHLPEDSLADYEHFVKMKSALIIEQRKLEDKVKLGEEQLKCLTDSLPIEQRLCL